MCHQFPTGPIRSLEPWAHCVPLDRDGFIKWFVDAVYVLNQFVRDVVAAMRELYDIARAKQSTAGGLHGWAWNEIKALPTP